ncbi:serine hydrolase domain-containing protein [Streptomyces huiliensis]|uniref:serine hydrolase domain-containing protein n=1 Tax=Streptomyces huiliensis TaxID=2876027 RepID=UPI001CC15B66|nr:serine hydrolase domain-containing protein [Streptomyces huiliensis]MBZ4319439.1 beta-lactamase family protein [Streptomyces huiliensis]
MPNSSVPTCVLSSVGHGKPSVAHGHDPDAFVEIGSLTKVLTGTLLTRLAADGVLDMDDPLEKWLPASTPGTGITLRHLADHTSGLPRLPPGLTSRTDPYRPFTDEALRALLPRLGALATAPPGERETYSNLGYAVLGAALAAADSRPYADGLRERVLVPLGVADDVAPRPPAGRPRVVPKGPFGRPSRPWTMDGAILPAGGLWATPRAAARVLTGLVVDRVLGDPAPSWQRAGELTWHNGATRGASVFAGAFPDGRWVLVHRLGGSPEETDRMGVDLLRR